MNDSREAPPSARLTAAELAEWRDMPTATISDETGCAGVMSSAIGPLTPGRRFAGHAVTIRTERESNGAPERVMHLVHAGDVIVIDASAHPDTAVWGGNLIDALGRRDGAAVVVDGRVRDTVELKASGLAVFASAVTPAGIPWGGALNVAIRCGGVEIVPGMLVVGDDDGVVALPVEDSARILARCRERLAREADGRRQDAASYRPTA